MSTKRTSFTELAGKPASKSDKPATPPVSALLHTITGNPDNPRDDDELDLEELIQSFREVGQLQPVLAVSRDVYLKHKPGNTKAIGDAEYVTIGGNRRLEAARTLGWARIDIALRDDLGDGEGSLDEAVIIENIHRKNLTPLKEAAFLKVMVDRYGSQGKVAKRIGKTQVYVSQRLALLKLDPELQEAVAAGELKVKEARQFNGLPAEDQRKVWQEKKETATAGPGKTQNPVMGSAPASAPPLAATSSPEVPPPASERVAPPQGVVPAQAAEVTPAPVTLAPPERIPDVKWGDPWAVREILMEWMDPKTRQRLLELLSDEFNETMAETGSEAS